MRAHILGLLLLALLTGCEYYERSNRAIPRDFKAHMLGGEQLGWKSFTGEAWVVLIWAPGSPLRSTEIARLEAARRELEGEPVRFLALSLGRDEAAVSSEILRLGISMPVAIADGEVLGPFGLSRVPSTVLVSGDGVVVAAVSGVGDRSFVGKALGDHRR